MEIWKRAADVSSSLFKLAARLDDQKTYRFAEQLRAAALSITNNIAEGSGSVSDVEFANFLNISESGGVIIVKDRRCENHFTIS